MMVTHCVPYCEILRISVWVLMLSRRTQRIGRLRMPGRLCRQLLHVRCRNQLVPCQMTPWKRTCRPFAVSGAYCSVDPIIASQCILRRPCLRRRVAGNAKQRLRRRPSSCQ